MARAVQIDASAHCQLACPVCPTATGKTRATLGAGHLRLGDFQRLLDANPEIAEVELSNYGELFLNPRLPELLCCAHERGVVVSGVNGVNLNFAREEALEAVVRYRVRGLTCSIDGATQETYSKYRINGDLNRVLGHIDKIRELRRERQAAFPMLNWQFVVFEHNQHEIEAARCMARKRGMEFIPRLSWSEDFSPVRNSELVSIQTGLGAASRTEFRAKNGREYTRELCFQLWHAPVLNWDGRLLGCCVNYWKDFGANVFETGLAAAMANPNLIYARRMLMGLAPARADIACSTCDQYEALASSGPWLTEREAELYDRREILIGLVPYSADGVRFGQFSIAAGKPSVPPRPDSGKLFRFGIDTAVYCSVPAPGSYAVFVQLLSGSGWLPPQAHVIHVQERPVCQEFAIRLCDAEPAPNDGDRPLEFLPSWIL